MPDVLHDFPIQAPIDRVFPILASPEGLNAWWTLTAEGRPAAGEPYRLGLGPGYDWSAVLRVYEPGARLEWEMIEADADWRGTRVGFALEPAGSATRVRFHHTGWRDANDHYRTSCYCWAMYLRLLTRYVERGEVVPYPQRLAV